MIGSRDFGVRCGHVLTPVIQFAGQSAPKYALTRIFKAGKSVSDQKHAWRMGFLEGDILAENAADCPILRPAWLGSG